MFLEGDPDVASGETVSRAQTLKDMFEADLRDEYEARSSYSKAASDCEEVGDIGSRELFIQIVHDEEGHIDWLETQISLLDRLGEPTYMQMYITPDTAEAEN